MPGSQPTSRTMTVLHTVLQRSAAFILDNLKVSAEGGFYPDPLHLGPAWGLIISAEAFSDVQRPEWQQAREERGL